MVNRIVNDDGEIFGAHDDASELLRPQHRVDQVHERGDAQDQRQQRHDVTYTRSQS